MDAYAHVLERDQDFWTMAVRRASVPTIRNSMRLAEQLQITEQSTKVLSLFAHVFRMPQRVPVAEKRVWNGVMLIGRIEQSHCHVYFIKLTTAVEEGESQFIYSRKHWNLYFYKKIMFICRVRSHSLQRRISYHLFPLQNAARSAASCKLDSSQH